MTEFKRRAAAGSKAISGVRNKLASMRFILAVDWLEDYAGMHGDRMPHNPTVFLPYKTIRWTLYKFYQAERSPVISKTAFYKMWSDHFPNLKIKQVFKKLCLKSRILVGQYGKS